MQYFRNLRQLIVATITINYCVISSITFFCNYPENYFSQDPFHIITRRSHSEPRPPRPISETYIVNPWSTSNSSGFESTQHPFFSPSLIKIKTSDLYRCIFLHYYCIFFSLYLVNVEVFASNVIPLIYVYWYAPTFRICKYTFFWNMNFMF